VTNIFIALSDKCFLKLHIIPHSLLEHFLKVINAGISIVKNHWLRRAALQFLNALSDYCFSICNGVKIYYIEASQLHFISHFKRICMATHNYQLKIELKNSKPKIWRRVIVPASLLLSDLHKVLQTTMGWDNAHLHQFIKGGKYYSLRHADDDFWDDHLNVDYTGQTVSDLLVKERDRIVYEYDFGDGWEHDVLLEKVLDEDKGLVLPVCLGGKMSCPPEDIGGVWGYE